MSIIKDLLNLHDSGANVPQIEFTLKRSKRKSVAIQVYPDCSVVVRAPMRLSERSINTFVNKRMLWVQKQQKKFSQFPQAKTREYISGEKFRYLGKGYILRVEFDLVNRVSLKDDEILLQTTTKNKTKIKKSLEDWYKQIASEIFTQRLPICEEAVRKLDIEFKGDLRSRKMRSRWGSCTSDGNITLNTRLVEHPLECIDYVLVHELCHLREMNHGRAFYELMNAAMPNWKEIRKTLR